MCTKASRELAEYVKFHVPAGAALADEALREAERIEEAAKGWVAADSSEEPKRTLQKFMRVDSLLRSIAKETER